MTQVASYAIANDSAAAVRAQMNQVLEALRRALLHKSREGFIS